MKKIGVVGSKSCSELISALEKNGIKTVCPEEADLLITYGGDGSLLGAVQRFPVIPKFPIRDSETAPLCPLHQLQNQLQLLKAGTLCRSMLPKLQGKLPDGSLVYGINDIFVHNSKYVSALRYRVWIDDVLYAREIVGDGAGVATVHGSSAYYRSITRSEFRTGIGLAFSNSTELVNHIVLPETSVIRIGIIRGPGSIAVDNEDNFPQLENGDFCEISLSGEKAEIYGLDIFMCPECRRLRHSHWRDFKQGVVLP